MKPSIRTWLMAGTFLSLTGLGLTACSRPTPARGGDDPSSQPAATEAIPPPSAPEGYQPPSPEADGAYPGMEDEVIETPDPYPGAEASPTGGG